MLSHGLQKFPHVLEPLLKNTGRLAISRGPPGVGMHSRSRRSGPRDPLVSPVTHYEIPPLIPCLAQDSADANTRFPGPGSAPAPPSLWLMTESTSAGASPEVFRETVRADWHSRQGASLAFALV